MATSRFVRSRSVPSTPWSAGASDWKASPLTFVVLIIGNWLYGTGEALLINANIGQTSGTVLAQGISKHLNCSIGWSTLYISVSVMLLWIPLRQRPGIGTLINIVLVSVSIDVMMKIIPVQTNLIAQLAQVLVGVFVFGVASALYITCNLGAGPRDGLMTGLNKKFNWPIAKVRLAMESIMLIGGWLLGGQVGIGTVIYTLLVGETIALCFGLVKSR
ncbi:MAG: YitT family protein [Actinomycetes bacterium]